MAGEHQRGGWVIHPSLWFDAVCLVPLLAGLPFYTTRHEQDVRWWQERFASAAGQAARDGLSVLSREVAERAGKPLPAFLALWTSPAVGSPVTGSPVTAAQCLDGLVAAVEDPELLISAMRETSAHWNEADDRLFRSVRPALLAVVRGLRAAGLAQWWAAQAETGLSRRCDELHQSLAAYDLVPLIERGTGITFDVRAVELTHETHEPRRTRLEYRATFPATET